MIERDRPLAGRYVLVTGGASGIGRATAQRLAADGADVVVDYVGDAEPAEILVAEIERDGGHAIAIEADVSDEAQVDAMFARARTAFDPVDVLVNNAGREKPFSLVDMLLAEWNAVLALNLTGPFLCCRALDRGLAPDTGGVIVNVSSVHELIPWPTFSHYCASKGGLKLFAQTIARELAPRGIRVVNVAPGA